MRGGGLDHQQGRDQLPHHQLQDVDEGLGGGGGGEDTHGVGLVQAEVGADSQLGGGGEEREEQQAEQLGGRDGLHLGGDHQADYQVVGEALTEFKSS